MRMNLRKIMLLTGAKWHLSVVAVPLGRERERERDGEGEKKNERKS